MIDILPLSIGVGLAISMFFSEAFGLAAGGMVVPGYLALHLHNPFSVLLTLLTSIVTYLAVHAMSSVAIIYGRRRTVMMVLVGFILGALVRQFFSQIGLNGLYAYSNEVLVIGYIIPGLIAIWIDRQGLLETLAALISASVVVRLILILAAAQEFQP